MIIEKLIANKKIENIVINASALQLHKRVGLSFIVNIFGTLITFLLNIELARILGVGVYGQYIYVLSWLTILVLVAKFGLDTTSLRFIPKYRSEKKYSLIRGFKKRATQALFLTSLLVGVILFIVVTVFSDNLDDELLLAFYMSAILLPVFSYLILRGAFLQSYNYTAYSQLLQLIIKPLLIAVTVFLFWKLSTFQFSSAIVISINLGATLLTILLSEYFFRKKLPYEYFEGDCTYETKAWLQVAVPLLFLTSFNMLINQTDIIMVGMILNTDEAGVYSVAARVCQFITFAMIVTNSVVAPMISKLYTEKKVTELQNMITMVTWLNGIFGVFVLLVLIVFGEYILGLFGEEFSEATQVMTILAISKIVLAFTGTSGYLMSMSGHQNNAAWVMGISAIANIVLNYVFIINYGVIGAAFASLITVTCWCGVMVYLVKKYVGVNSTILVKI